MPEDRVLIHRLTLEQMGELRDDMEHATPEVRHRATLELIARGYFLAYSDARHAARLALTGAHARQPDCLDCSPAEPLTKDRAS